MLDIKDIMIFISLKLIIVIIILKQAESVIPTVQPFSFPVEVTKGQSVTVICAVLSGTGPFTFRWTKDTEILADHPPLTKIQTQDDFSLLSLRSTNRSRSGNYTCIVSNEVGSGNYTARLVVYEQPEWVLIPDDTEVTLGRSVKIDCKAIGAPKPNITWRKLDGSKNLLISEVGRNKMLQNGSLLLENVRLTDQGTYECSANNNIGEVLKQALRVIVHIPPQFREDFELLKVRSSHSAALQCEVTGDRPLTVNWTKDYQVESNESRQKIQKTPLPNGLLSELFITRVSRQDAGLYICTASNPFGRRERTIKLVVLEPPSSPSDIIVKQIGSDEVTIRWSTPYSGNSPVIHYILQYWKDTGAPPKLEEGFAESDKTSAVLTSLKPGTPYVLRLVAENEFGQSTPSIPVKFSTSEENPSGYPTDLIAVPKGPHTILVQWKPPPPDQRNGLIRGYDLGYRERQMANSYKYQEIQSESKDDDDVIREYLLDQLQASTEYEVTIRAFNAAGRGPLSMPVVVKTNDQGSLIAPILWVESTSASSISLKWSTNLEDKNFYYKLYYRIENGAWMDETFTDPKQDTYLLSGLEENTIYEIFLQTIRGQNRSSPSTILKASTADPSASMRSSVSHTTATASNPSMTTLIISLSVVTSAVIIVCIVAGACVYVVRIRTRSSRYKDDMGSRHLSDQRSASESMRISQSAHYRYVDVNSRPLLWCPTPAPPAHEYPSPYATLPLRSTPLSKRWQSEGEGLSLAQSERSESLVNQRVDTSEDKPPSCAD